MVRRWQRSRAVETALPELRRRTAWLVATMDARSRAFVRLLPLLLMARFRRPGLDGDAPGVKLMPRRRRWGALCAALDLPPPSGFCAARALVASVTLAPRGDGHFDVLVLPVEDVAEGEHERLVSRIRALAALAARQCPALEVHLATHAELTPSLVPWAAVCAGEMPNFSSGPLDRLDVLRRAPTPLARCLALLVDESAPAPLAILREHRGLTTPEAFAARWAGSVPEAAWAPSRVRSLEDLCATGHELRRRCIAALRAMPPHMRRPARLLLRHELFASTLPQVFRGALERLVRGRSAVEHAGPHGWTLAVDGVVLASGQTLDQLRAVALAETPLLARGGPLWSRVAQLIGTGAPRAIVVVEAAGLQHLVLRLTPAGRPKARRVDAGHLLRFALDARVRGVACEIVASVESDPEIATRLARLARLTPAPTRALGLEVGDRLLLAEHGRLRAPSLRAALARPRSIAWLPLDPELERSLRAPPPGPLPIVNLTAFPLGEARAAVYAVDGQGQLLREEVARATLERHLVESRELIRQGAPPALVSISVHPTLAVLAGRRLDADLPTLGIDVDCAWPHALRVWLDGESFCGPGDLGWGSLAEAVLSHWPPGTWGRVGVRRVAFLEPPPSPSPLYTLAVRARVLRRLSAGLRRLTRVLEAA